MHDESRILLDVTAIAIMALVMELIALRFKIAPVIGLLLAGAIAGLFGPNGLHLLGHGTETLLLLAEVGVGFLVLPIGIEFDLKKLLSMWKQVLLGGLIQLAITTLVSYLVYSTLFAGNASTSLLVGFLTTMSSTVVVVERLEERKKLHTPGGKLAVGILIFQDLSLLPLAFILPALRPGAGTTWILPLLMGVMVLGFAFWLELRLINPFLKMIIAKNDKALLTLALVAICLSLVVTCMFVNLSPVFGMFLAGLLLSRTESRCEVLGIALQAKKVFGPLHFVSFGLLLDYHLIGEFYLKIAVSVVGLILIKLFTGWLTSVLMGYTLKTACKVSGALAHIGELSFVLAALGAKLGIIKEIDFKVFVIIAVATIFLSPLVMTYFIKLGDKFVDKNLFQFCFSIRMIRNLIIEFAIRLWQLFGDSLYDFIPKESSEKLDTSTESSVVIIGYGIVGRYVASSLIARGIPVCVIESSNDSYQLAQHTSGISKVVFGDSSNIETLREANVGNARAVVMTFSGVSEREVTLNCIRQLAADIPVIVRVHRATDVGTLQAGNKLVIVIGEAAAAAASENELCQALGIPNVNPADVGNLGSVICQHSGHLLEIRRITTSLTA